MKETDLWRGRKVSNWGHYGQAGIRLLLEGPCVQAQESNHLYAPPGIHTGSAVEQPSAAQSLGAVIELGASLPGHGSFPQPALIPELT